MSNVKNKPSNLDKARAAKRKPKTLKTYRIPIRLTTEQRKTMEQNAKALGYSKTEFCRNRILGYRVKDKSPAQVKLRRNLIQGCNNLNQISHKINKQGVKPETIAEIEDLIRWFRIIREQINNE